MREFDLCLGGHQRGYVMHQGYIKVWRKLKDSGLLQSPKTLALFMFLLLNATHKTIKKGTPNGVVDLNRGQFLSGRKKLAAELGQSEKEIRTSITKLKKMGILGQQTASKYSIYTIVNYDKYQDYDDERASTSASRGPAEGQQRATKQEHKHINTRNNINTFASRSGEITFQEFLDTCDENGESPIPEGSAVFKWQKTVGLTPEFLNIGWIAFSRRKWLDQKGKPKKYKNWRRVFLEYCQNPDWLKVWKVNGNGEFYLTDMGKQIQLEVKNGQD